MIDDIFLVAFLTYCYTKMRFTVFMCQLQKKAVSRLDISKIVMKSRLAETPSKSTDMKTKLLFFFLFLVSFLENAAAQEYHPFLDNSAWVVNDWVSCCRPPEVKVIEPGTDVVIGAFTYKKYIDPFPQWSVSPSVLMDTILPARGCRGPKSIQGHQRK